MPMTTNHSGLSLYERVSFCANVGCCSTLLSLSFSRESTCGRVASAAGERWMIHTGWPRQATVMRCPGSTLPMSASTGAPAFFARALGCHDLMKGIAAVIAPIPPTTLVVAVRKRRRPWFTPSFAIRHSEKYTILCGWEAPVQPGGFAEHDML